MGEDGDPSRLELQVGGGVERRGGGGRAVEGRGEGGGGGVYGGGEGLAGQEGGLPQARGELVGAKARLGREGRVMRGKQGDWKNGFVTQYE